MSFDGRTTRLEREIAPGDGARMVRHVTVIEDLHDPLEPGELEAFLDAVVPAGTVCIARIPDNGRGDRGAHVSFGGDGWEHPGFGIEGGRILGNWRGDV